MEFGTWRVGGTRKGAIESRKMKYEDAPLVEAVFDAFVLPTNCSPEMARDLEAALEVGFPGPRKTVHPMGIHFQVGPGRVVQQGVQPEPDRVRSQHPPFSMQVQAEQLAGGGQVVLTLTAQGVVEGNAQYILDVYARSDTDLTADWSVMEAWQTEAHDAIKRCFELSITKESRKLFRQVEE